MQEILDFIIEYGYIIIALYSFGGGLFGLVAAGFLASTGQLNLPLLILIAGTSNFIGDSFFFLYSGFIKKFFRKDYFRLVRKFSRKIAYTKLLIRKYGNYSVFIQKYIKYVRILYPIIVSIMGQDKKKFFIGNFFASFFWAISILVPSYYFAPYIMSFLK